MISTSPLTPDRVTRNHRGRRLRRAPTGIDTAPSVVVDRPFSHHAPAATSPPTAACYKSLSPAGRTRAVRDFRMNALYADAQGQFHDPPAAASTTRCRPRHLHRQRRRHAHQRRLPPASCASSRFNALGTRTPARPTASHACRSRRRPRHAVGQAHLWKSEEAPRRRSARRTWEG